MRKALTKKQAKAIWQVLVEECGAIHYKLEVSFVDEYSTASKGGPVREWRFCGALGGGGVFRYPSLSVDCAPEDKTPARLAAIKAANERLSKLKDEMSITLEGA